MRYSIDVKRERDKERNRDAVQALGFQAILPIDTTNRYQPAHERRRDIERGF